MSALPISKLTVGQYLAIERAAAFKSEFYRGEMFAMAGASHLHNRTKENLIGEMFSQLKGGPCRSLSSDQRVKVSASGLYTYPDIVIVCGKAEFDPDDRDTLINPQVIFEILSKSTENYDRGKKFEHYQKIASLREYVLVSQDQMRIDRYVRQSDNEWILTVFADQAAEFTLATVAVRMPMRDIFAGVEFEPPEAEAP